MSRQWLQMIVITALAGASATGCSSAKSGSSATVAGSGSASPTDSTTVSSTTPSTTAFTSSATTTASVSSTVSASRASMPLCTSDIRVIPGTVQGAAGHRSLVLVFNNVSSTTTCEIIGYPGVDLVTGSGTAVAHLTRTLRGMAGGEPPGVSAPQPVTLAPGASASALAEASAVPQGGISDCGNFSLMITVPNQYVAVSGGTAALPRCDAQIHPVVPGTTGGMN